MRRDHFPRLVCALVVLLLVVFASALVPVNTPPAQTGTGSVDVLQAQYSAWAETFEAIGARHIVLPLGRMKGLTAPGTADLYGSARVDFGTGAVDIEVHGAESTAARCVAGVQRARQQRHT